MYQIMLNKIHVDTFLVAQTAKKDSRIRFPNQVYAKAVTQKAS